MCLCLIMNTPSIRVILALCMFNGVKGKRVVLHCWSRYLSTLLLWITLRIIHLMSCFVFLKTLSSDPEVILCNNTKMLRERLSITGERLGEEHREQDDDYVYDLYYQETVTPGWIQDILSVRAYADEGELVCVDGWTDR